MHCARRAPELSATVSIVRSWIMVHSTGPCAAPDTSGLLRPLHELDETPALLLRQGPGLHEADGVPFLALVLLVVNLEPAAPAHVALVHRVLDQALDHDHDGLFHLVRHDLAYAELAPAAFLFLLDDSLGHHAVPPFASLRRRSVSTRAMSRRALRILSGSSSCRIEFLKRFWNSWSRSSRSRVSSSTGVRFSSSRKRLPAMSVPSQLDALDEAHADRKLRGAQAHRGLGGFLRDALELEHDPARANRGDPELRRALALAHSRFRRLLGHRLVRKDPDPHLAATLDRARDRHARGLDLAVGDPRRLEGLQAVLAEGHRRPAIRLAPHAPALLLAVLDPLRHQHGRGSVSSRKRRGQPSWAPRSLRR